MAVNIKVFFISPTDRYEQKLRRGAGSEASRCAIGKPYSYCTAHEIIAVIQADKHPTSGMLDWPHDDPRWPKFCSQCKRSFTDADLWMVDHDRLYGNAEGKLWTLRDAPVGACWNAFWLADSAAWAGPDGRSLVVKCPNGETTWDWCIDQRASNCTLPDDDVHKCWVRHGSPEEGTLHVDKNGHTCGAGAGSIALPNWHGFLHNGHLVG